MLGRRLAASAGLTLVVVGGVIASGRLTASPADRADSPADSEASDPERGAGAGARTTVAEEAAFATGLAEDLRAHGLPPMTVEELARPNRYASELDHAVVLGRGRSWSSPHLRITAAIEKVRYHRHGATVSAPHALALIRNVSDVPIAYFVRLRSADRGACEVRGARAHNAMALMPGEEAQVVVCAGKGKIRFDRVEVLEITPIGDLYFSRVPPVAVGYDEVTLAAHRLPEGVRGCTTFDTGSVEGWLREGRVRWVDIADFYSRHDCDRASLFPAYRHATSPVPHLPVTPPP